jgi:transcriptional regulator with XRE-family HTH domain
VRAYLIEEDYMGQIGIRIRELRESRGLTQSEVASRAGVTPSAINSIESGRTKEPSASTVAAIARAIGVGVKEVFEEPMLPLVSALHSQGKLEELRQQARGEDTESVRVFESITAAYNGVVAEYERMRDAGTSHEDMLEVEERYRTLRKLWRVVLSERIAETVAHDSRRSPDAPTYPNTTELPLDEAFELVRAGAVLQFAD